MTQPVNRFFFCHIQQRVVTACLYLVCVVGAGCNNGRDTRALQEEHQEMAERLKEISRNLDPMKNEYVNNKRAAAFADMENETGGNIQSVFWIRYNKAYEMLLAGRTGEAIPEARTLYDAIESGQVKTDPLGERKVRALLPLCYIRLGEQQNCIFNHSSESCILPFSEKGQHVKEEGSRTAVALYTELLDRYPDDYTFRWLLNVASMTLGEYPENVPQRYLIPDSVFESGYPLPAFRDIASARGVDVNARAGGLVLDDLDNDGYVDILCSSWGLTDPIRYFRNTGHGSFIEATREANLSGISGGLNMIHADYDNDGYKDVFVLRGAWLSQGEHPNSLLKNQGDGTFMDVTKSAGLLSFHPTQTACWGDYNNDGWLDLFIGNESSGFGGSHPCELYQNTGEGTFVNVAAECGVNAELYAKGSAWEDYDNDGDIDLYISAVKGFNRLYRNDGPNTEGRWQFTDVAKEAGVREPFESFPVWFFDYDNDGWPDLFVAGYTLRGWNDMAGLTAADYLGVQESLAPSKLYRNNRDGTFEDVSSATGLDRELYTMGCNFGDLDNDGWLDFYLGTGEPDLQAIIPNRMFRNDRGRGFQDVTTAGRFGHLQKGHGIGFADLDNDGDQDIYAVMGGAYEGDVFRNILFENPGNKNHWVTLHLRGTTANWSAIGARVTLHTEGPGGLREIHVTVNTGGSFGSSSLAQEIGVGDATAIEKVEVRWPGGNHESFGILKVDRAYLLKEGTGEALPVRSGKASGP